MGYLKLKDTGAHSVGINNNSGKQIIRARPECIVVNPLTVSVSGGTAGSPQVQHAANGLISAGTELWFRLAGSNELVKGTVGGVAVSGAGPYTYTLTDIVPALASLPVSAFRLRADATKAMMALACGALDEPLCGETPLDLVGTGTTASQVAIASPSSILAYLAATNLCRDLLITSGGVETAMTPTGPATETPGESAITHSSSSKWTGDGVPHCTFNGTNIAKTSGSYGYYLACVDTMSGDCFFQGVIDFSQTEGSLYVALCNSGGTPAAYVYEAGYGADNFTDFIFMNVQAQGGGVCSVYWKSGGGTIHYDSLVARFADGDTIRLERNGSAYTIKKNSVVVYTFPAGANYAGTLRTVLQFEAITTDSALNDISWGRYTPYVTIVPHAAQASPATAVKLRNRYLIDVAIASVTYAAGPELTVTGVDTELPDNAALKRLALMLRGDVSTGTPRARAGKIYIKERTI